MIETILVVRAITITDSHPAVIYLVIYKLVVDGVSETAHLNTTTRPHMRFLLKAIEPMRLVI